MNISQSTSERELNQVNLAMRSQPWYQQFFAQRGLNQNRVQLNDRQRAELTQLAARNGMPLGPRMKFDGAGNINQQGGWAGMPPWAKTAIIAGATVATAGAAGVFTGPAIAPSIAGGGVPGGVTGAGTIAGISGVGSTADAAVGSAAVSTGFGLSDILMASLSPAIGTVAGIYQSRAMSNAGRDASDAQTSSANYAADLQSKAAEEQLAYLREQEAQRRKEFESTEARNFGIYTEERDYDRGLYDQRQSRLKPYRQFGEGSIRQLGRPMQNIRQAGTIGSMRGR